MNLINRSSSYDLYRLSEAIGLDGLIIITKRDFPLYEKHFENIIINMNDESGTHWVAVNTLKKVYFDTYNQPPPNIIPKKYKISNHNFEVQSIDAQDCGQLSLLFLYFIKFRSIPDFYKMFKDVY
jgi:hypothetical protein